MQTFKTRTFALAAILVGSVDLATAAHADLPRMRVSYADLDTASAQGKKQLMRRIDRAANEVCSVHDIDFSQRAEAYACHDRAVSNARSDLAERGVTLR